MTERVFHDVSQLVSELGARDLDEVADMIDEAASDVGDGRFVSIDDRDPDALNLVVDTIGFGIEFPTTFGALVVMANEIEQLLQEQGS